MNRALGHLCAHIGSTGPGEPPEDGKMIEMTLSSRDRIRNSRPDGLRPSTLPLVAEDYKKNIYAKGNICTKKLQVLPYFDVLASLLYPEI